MRNPARRSWWRLVDWRVVLAVGLPVWGTAGAVVLGPKPRPATAGPSPAQVRPGPARVEPNGFVGPPAPPAETGPGGPLLWSNLPFAAVVPNLSPALPAPDLVLAAAVDARVRQEKDRARVAEIPPPVVPAPQPNDVKPGPPGEIGGCKTYGTFVAWRTSPAEAFRKAAKADKLVFVLHLAGNIEDDGFT